MKHVRHPLPAVASAVFVLLATVLALPSPAHANAPGLQLTPLQYEDTLGGKVKNGHIDVANPTDTTLTIDTSVRGFNQHGTGGDLRFFDDPELTTAIKVDLSSFELGPRQAVRVLFSIDPSKLSKGGVYAAIFFRTRSSEQSSTSSYVSQSANVGTLLILNNDGPATPVGGLTQLSFPLWQFGRGLSGVATVANTSSAPGGVAFRPALDAHVFPWGRRVKQTTGLVLPSASRQFTIQRSGSFFGLLPVTVADAATHSSRTAWVIACTGFYAWLVLVLALAALIFLVLRLLRRRYRLRHIRRPHRSTAQTPNPQPAATQLVTAEPPASDPLAPDQPNQRVSVTVVAAEPEPAPPQPTPKVHKVKLTPEPKPVKVKLTQTDPPAKPVQPKHKVKVEPAPKANQAD
jgi:heme exporter protein D